MVNHLGKPLSLDRAVESLSDLSLEQRQFIDQLADEFEAAWRADHNPSIESVLAANPAFRTHLLKELIAIEIELRRAAGELPRVQEYKQRFPDDTSAVEAVYYPATDLASTADPSRDAEVEEDETQPERLGRYVIQRQLGRGGFGVVYLAFDPQLGRSVALKIPRRKRFKTAQQVASFIQEASTAAKLKHHALVAVHDVQEHDGLPYIVQEYIEGPNLADWAKHQPSFESIAKVLLEVSEAIGYAHQQGLTHCDLKLANVLIDSAGQPHVADFGLAVHENTQGLRKGEVFGTPAMMAPEQVRGESHRLDGRTDIWAIGVMLYQLLVGRRPFTATNRKELFNEIQTLEPKPPRQIDRSVPRELERICLKCLSKHKSDRYNTTDDLGEDLSAWLQQADSTQVPKSSTVDSTGVAPLDTPDSSSGSKPPARIIPKGLRSFDSGDADFFLDLLPGPRDRDGLPESIRFWKKRIEETDPDQTFSVGLMYGPSGCGKSSLVKAGLLPRLSDQVLAIYVEATGADTEVRILKQLRKHVPRLPADVSLVDACAEIRLTGAGRQRKVLLVIDQFEQWLHSHPGLRQAQLIDALRQCEGERLQAMLLVRDDFFASVNRLFRELEDPLVEGRNYALVDRFDRQYACKVLTAFGRAYGKLDNELSMSQEQFISRAVEELVEEDKVISVRLSLFADMMKMRQWTIKSLTEMGGASGVGVTFLEETFNGKAAPPTHREHQAAIRQVLKALLPESGTDIKGGMRSADVLRVASGYGSDHRRFDELLRILDSELRIITPTDPEGIAKEEDRSLKPEPSPNSSNSSLQTSNFTFQTSLYQLTHDYLVPSLRDWLTRKQRETRRGRAELKLEERANTWHSKPESRFLPSLWEYLQIRTLTDKAKWKPVERQLMSRSDRYHTLQTGMVTTLGILLMLGGLGFKRWNDARQLDRDATNLVSSIETADYSKLPDLIGELDRMRPVVDPKLKVALNQYDLQSDERLKLSLGLMPSDPAQVDYLLSRLLAAEATQVPLLVGQLRPHAREIEPQLWTTAQQRDPRTLLQAASALASYAPDGDRWSSIAAAVVDQVVRENPLRLAVWIEALRPVTKSLNPELQRIYASSALSRPQTEIDLATEILQSYAADDFKVLHELMLTGQARQFTKMFANYTRFRQPAIEALRGELARPFSHQAPNLAAAERLRLEYVARQANAAAALLRLEDPTPVYDFLTVDRDSEALSQFIYRIRGREVSPSLLIKSFQELQTKAVPQDSLQHQQHDYRLYGFLLGLGEYTLEQLPAQERDAFVEELAEMYGTHPSRAIHSALGWLLRRWGQDEAVRRVDETPKDYDTSGVSEWYVLKIDPPRIAVEGDTDETANGKDKNNDTDTAESENPAIPKPLIDLTAPIYFTMIVFPGGEFAMGESEATKQVTVTGPLAVSDREVTWRQFSPIDGDSHRQDLERQFIKDMGGKQLIPNGPAFGVSWFEAVNYCRWLSSASGLDERSQSYERLQFPPGAVRRPGWLDLRADTEWPMQTGRPGFRLLTEAEWEYAARSGTMTTYSFGDSESLLAEYSWYQTNSEEWSHSTGLLRPSVGGLFDIHGNLFEWTNDWYSRGSFRVIRGGGWEFAAKLCRSANRNYDGPTNRTGHIGFRLAQSPSCQVTAEHVQVAEPSGVGTEGAKAEPRPEMP